MQDPTDRAKVLNRTWTISSHPSEQTAEKAFSISVKQVGLISGWLHTRFSKDGVLEWRGVGGTFTPQEHTGPALLLAGGIGEPLASAARTLQFHSKVRNVCWCCLSQAADPATARAETACTCPKIAHSVKVRVIVTYLRNDVSHLQVLSWRACVRPTGCCAHISSVRVMK